MTNRSMIASTVALALMALPAFAQDTRTPAAPVASATAVTGPVQVNQGERFLPLHAGQALRAGDRVMALMQGSATITFADGCTLTVEPETMVSVPATSTCAGGVVVAQAIAPGSSQAVGASAAGATGIDTAGAATVIGVGLVGNAILFSQDEENNDETVSP